MFSHQEPGSLCSWQCLAFIVFSNLRVVTWAVPTNLVLHSFLISVSLAFNIYNYPDSSTNPMSSIRFPELPTLLQSLGHLQQQCVCFWRNFARQILGATTYSRLKVPDRGKGRALIGRKGGDHPSSFHTRRWRPKGPKKISWMKNLHGGLHGRLWIRVHGLWNLHQAHLEEVGLTQIPVHHDFFSILFPARYVSWQIVGNIPKKDKHQQIIILNW